MTTSLKPGPFATSLVVFDCLEVGPVTLTPRRFSAPYRLFYNGIEEEIQFQYNYEEDVYDLADPAALNLAAMQAAQLALNYGLFCKRIVFHGSLDEADQRFIKDMAENSAREIYVKKFLEPNPFLIGEAAALQVRKQSRYLNARLEFPDAPTSPVKWRLWSNEPHRHAILSSGGKDSLLSYGLMTELGYDTHPIFVNESGRHWFTALNAYNYFKDSIGNTGRVWTNSDRVFSWMLRRMPFIRGDFPRVRSDDYPIRLWTVALFIFGVIPIIRKRKIARLLVGDEYDTTRRCNYEGITHYDGLYDQSRYFDNAMSRYFLRKGWGISQFSILRPVSEIVIQKILTERYPHLQMHQVSCHAAHKEGDRILPCGRCEKCRRIVAMLTALDADPTRCGYKEEQIGPCLERIIGKGVHQDSVDARQLFFMLEKKGAVTVPVEYRKMVKERPEVLKLRFDPERSPADGIPLGLRAALYGIYLEYTDGAVRREGRSWKPFNPLSDSILNQPYTFEPAAASRNFNHPSKSPDADGEFLWGEMNWPEAEKRFQEVDIALLPVGAIEQHGPHLPLDTDAFDADYLARRVASACSHPRPLVLPLIPYGVSYEHNDFKGTVSITNESLANLVYDIGVGVSRNGIKKVVIINGHGGNGPALNYAAQMINRDAGIFVCVDSGDTSDVDIYKIIDTPNDIHAGEVETSTSLAVRPHLVKMESAPTSIPRFSSRYLNFTSKRFVNWYGNTRNVSETGVLGDATKASVEKGKEIWQLMVAHLLALVEDLKNLSLDEIFNRRY